MVYIFHTIIFLSFSVGLLFSEGLTSMSKSMLCTLHNARQQAKRQQNESAVMDDCENMFFFSTLAISDNVTSNSHSGVRIYVRAWVFSHHIIEKVSTYNRRREYYRGEIEMLFSIIFI